MPARWLEPTLRHWRDLHRSLIWVYQGEVPESGRHRRINKAEIDSWFMLKGSVETITDGEVRVAHAGQWLFPSCGRLRQQNFSEDAEIVSICFHAHWPNGRPLYDHGLGLVLDSSEEPRLASRALRLAAKARKVSPGMGMTRAST